MQIVIQSTGDVIAVSAFYERYPSVAFAQPLTDDVLAGFDARIHVPVVPAPTLEQLQADLIAAATAHRWAVEVGGITLPNGIQIKTGTDDQARITSVIANAHLAGVTEVDFKAASGWVSLTLTEVEGIAAAIALHVQACFAAERAHHEAIEALQDIEAAQTYDVLGGWPA